MQIIKIIVTRTKSDKGLRDKEYNIASNPKYDGYQRGLASMVYKFFDQKSMGSGTVKPSSLESSSSILADELHKPVIKKLINDTVPYTYNLKDLNDEKIIGTFYDRELQKTKL